MRSVYVQSKSLVRRGLYERESMAHIVSGRFGRHGQQRWGLGAGHVRQEHNMHAFTSNECPSHFLRQILRRVAIRFAIVDCMNAHIRCRSRSASGGLAGDGRVQRATGALLGALLGPLVSTRGP